MARGGLHGKPYTTFQFVYGFIGSVGEWNWFHGWCLTRGLDPTGLRPEQLIAVGLAYIEHQALVEEGVHKARGKIRAEIARLQLWREESAQDEYAPALPGLREAPLGVEVAP